MCVRVWLHVCVCVCVCVCSNSVGYIFSIQHVSTRTLPLHCFRLQALIDKRLPMCLITQWRTVLWSNCGNLWASQFGWQKCAPSQEHRMRNDTSMMTKPGRKLDKDKDKETKRRAATVRDGHLRFCFFVYVDFLSGSWLFYTVNLS